MAKTETGTRRGSPGAKQFHDLSSLFIGFIYTATVSLILRSVVENRGNLLIRDHIAVLFLIVFVAADWAIRYRVRRVTALKVKPVRSVLGVLLELAAIYPLCLSIVYYTTAIRSNPLVEADVPGHMTGFAAFAFFALLSWAWNLSQLPLLGQPIRSALGAVVVGDAISLPYATRYFESAQRFRKGLIKRIALQEAKCGEAEEEVRGSWPRSEPARWRKPLVAHLRAGGHIVAGIMLDAVGWGVKSLFHLVAQFVLFHVLCANLYVGIVLFIANQYRGDRPLLHGALLAGTQPWLVILVAAGATFFFVAVVGWRSSTKWRRAGALALLVALLLWYAFLPSLGLVVALMVQQFSIGLLFHFGLPGRALQPPEPAEQRTN